MTERDAGFAAGAGLQRAVELLGRAEFAPTDLPKSCPEAGVGESAALDLLAPHVLGAAARLDSPNALANMDPPTPWITWAMALWNARLNQNLLHPATAPFAVEAEKRVVSWLAPFFGMHGGHMCAGSTLANLTSLWAARDAHGVNRIVASEAAHLSIRKSANLLGLAFETIPTDGRGRLDESRLGDVDDACLVLTAGTTASGQIDPLALAGRAKWTHVDAAWAGPLRVSRKHGHLLNGIEQADSISVSAHKWLFQPKDSALVMFREPDVANEAISFSGGYLAVPNIGVQGSRGAAAVPLLATMLAWGSAGIAERIDRTMAMSGVLARELASDGRIALWGTPVTAITVFRPLTGSADDLHAKLPAGTLSMCTLGGNRWLRSVAANPLADVDNIVALIRDALG